MQGIYIAIRGGSDVTGSGTYPVDTVPKIRFFKGLP
jgi:hypothetical protein